MTMAQKVCDKIVTAALPWGASRPRFAPLVRLRLRLAL